MPRLNTLSARALVRELVRSHVASLLPEHVLEKAGIVVADEHAGLDLLADVLARRQS